MTPPRPTAPEGARSLSPLKKGLFTLGLLLLVLGAFECGLRCTDIGQPIEKLWFRTAEGYGNCYSVDEEGYFPLSIRDSRADRERLRRMLTRVRPHQSLRGRYGPLGIDDLVRRTPYCIAYDRIRRREGFFSDRRRHVALIGDSFAFGEGVRDEDTLAYLMGQRVADANFLDFGAPGADIPGVRAVMTDLLEHEPDLDRVIYVFNLNDIFLDSQGQPDVDIDPGSEFLYGPGDRGWIGASRILTLIRTVAVQRRRTRKTVRAFLERYRNGAALRMLAGHLRAMADAAEAHKLPFHVVIHPLLHKDPFGSYPFGAIHRGMLDLCRRERISCVDAYPAFAGHRSLDGFRVNAVDSHPNGRSNRLVADYLVASAPHLFRPGPAGVGRGSNK
jgi:hypothetical protein